MNKKNLIIFILAVVILFGCGALYLKSSGGGQNTTSISGTREVVSSDPVKNTTSYTLADVGTHNTSDNCWMVIDGNVYDATEYIASGQHNPQIIKGCGVDATSMFNSERKHSGGEAQNMLSKLKIGVLAQ